MRLSRNTFTRAFTLIEFFITLACLAIIVALFLPTLARNRTGCGQLRCANNLRQVGLSFRTWALDNQERYPMQVSVTNGGTMELVEGGPAFIHFLVMSNELSTPTILVCPNEPNPGRSNATTFAQLPGVPQGQIPFNSDAYLSYFVGVDAGETRPRAPVAGDLNLAVDGRRLEPGLRAIFTNSTVTWLKPRHEGGGYICFADGSVARIRNVEFPGVLLQSGMPTNRLAVP